MNIFILLAAFNVLLISCEASIFARFIRRWSPYDEHGWESDHEQEAWEDPWRTKTKTIVKIKPVIKIKHVVKEIPVYKTVKVYKTIPVYKEVPVVKEVKVIKHIHVHKKEHHPPPAVKGWQPEGGHQATYIGEAKHATHDLVGKVYEVTLKDSGSGAHHQWPANTEDKEKIWNERGWQAKEAPAHATAETTGTHATGGHYENSEEWKSESEGSASGKHWLPPQGWIPPEGWVPPPGWQPPPGWKEWVQKRKSDRRGSAAPRQQQQQPIKKRRN